MLVQKTGKVSVHSLISADELIAECEAWHKPSLFQPENGAEGSREEDTFDGCECNQTFGKAAGCLNPLERPICFLRNAGDVGDSFEEEVFFFGVLTEGVNQN